MAKFCRHCGFELRGGSKFCTSCGGLIDDTSAALLASEDIIDQPEVNESAINPALIGALVALLIVSALAFGGWLVGWFDSERSAVGAISSAEADFPEESTGSKPQSWFEDYSDKFRSGTITQFVTSPARKRDYPTSKGSTVQQTLETGVQLTGRWVEGADPSTKWLRVENGGYVWEGNLDDQQGYSNPVQFCAAKQNSASPESDRSYIGPKSPSWIWQTLNIDPKELTYISLTWRCSSGRVLACTDSGVGGTRPCAKGDISSKPNQYMYEFCSDYQNRDIPAAVTGQSIYDWTCKGSRPVSRGQIMALDRQGYFETFWEDVTKR